MVRSAHLRGFCSGDSAGGSGRIELRVDDDGQGLEPGERQDVLERGTRLDVLAPGSGLGLGIVRDVVTSYRGDLRLEDSELGGLRAVVTLPC